MAFAQNQAGLFKPVCYPALCQIIGCHFDEDLIAGKNPNAVFAHAPGRVSNDFMLVFQLHTEGCIGQQLRDNARKFEDFFLSHIVKFILFWWGCGSEPPFARETTQSLRLCEPNYTEDSPDLTETLFQHPLQMIAHAPIGIEDTVPGSHGAGWIRCRPIDDIDSA